MALFTLFPESLSTKHESIQPGMKSIKE